MSQEAESDESDSQYIPDNETATYLERFDDEKTIRLAAELATHPTLEELHLTDGWIGDNGAIALAHALTTNKSLRTLLLYRNDIGDAGVESLAWALTQNESLECLVVCENAFGIVGVTSIANALKINKRLTHLSVSCDNEGAKILAEMLKCNTTLQELNCFSSHDIGDEGAISLSEALRNNTTLTSLRLESDYIGDVGAESILRCLTESNTTLISLDLCDNDISGPIRDAVEEVVDANLTGIRFLGTKLELDMSSREIETRQAKLVARELSTNSAVTTLILSKNRIADDGSVEIAGMLAKNRTLMTIGLDDNYIGETGSSAIAKALRENTVVTKLSLNGNNIGLTGAAAFADMLLTNTTVQQLGLGRNNISDDGVVAIVDALKVNKTLTGLDLDGNSIGDRGILAILKALLNYNCTMMSLNLEANANESPLLLQTVMGVLASRQVLDFLLRCLLKPLEGRAIPLVVQAVHQGTIFHKEAGLTDCDKVAGSAGFVFHLVRAAAVNDSKVIKEMTPSRKRPRMP
jgi:Ran GTPase-activating protein (RanGAP) involved in mRNA processing and transport